MQSNYLKFNLYKNMSVEKTNIFGDDEEIGQIIDYSNGDKENNNQEDLERPEIGPEEGLEIVPNKKKEPELPPSMRIIPDKRKPKKPEKPN